MTRFGGEACAWLIQSVRAVNADPTYGPKLRLILPAAVTNGLTSDDCVTWTSTVSTTSVGVQAMDIASGAHRGSTGGRVQPMAAITSGTFRPFWNQGSFGLSTPLGNVALFTVHVNVGIVWLGPTTFTTDWRVDSRAWGPDCYVTTVPGYSGGWDSGGWCGVHNDNIAWQLMPGCNFHLDVSLGPYFTVYRRWGWIRYYAYSNGSKSYPWRGMS